MPMSNFYIIGLIHEYLMGKMNEVHRRELEEWLEESDAHRVFFEKVCQDRSFVRRWKIRETIDAETAIRRFDRKTGGISGGNFWKKYKAYAAILILLLTVGGGIYFMADSKETEIASSQTDMLPGSSKALLILAGGEKIQLSSGDSLNLELEKGVKIVGKNSGLVYEIEGGKIEEDNKLIIPKGGEYRLKLSDGTVVRMNSASSLTYPVLFRGEKREVVLTGEAWFEVAKSDVPFYVHAGELTVRVYGTRFNITSYKNIIRTALVEGKVGITVRGTEKEYLLRPSELAEFDTESGKVNIRETDLSPYIAWTKGLFVFTNETLEEILYTLSLWYNMEIQYEHEEVRNLHFTGCVKRYERVDHILNALSQSVGVSFCWQGNQLRVSKRSK